MDKKYPVKILLFSGKRKSGKDYITEALYNRLKPDSVVIVKISAPIKSHWAQVKGLDYDKLLSCGEYKEMYRQEMIVWSEEVRSRDYGYFCSASVDMVKAEEKPIWIVSDIRRKTDIKWFSENYGKVIKKIRIVADEETRKKRGWKFTPGVDDIASECDLDDVTDWDKVIHNNESENIESVLDDLVKELQISLVT